MAQVEAIDFSPIAKLGEQAMEFSQRGQLRDIQRERLALAQQRQTQDIALRQQQEARQAETAKVDLAAKEFKNQEAGAEQQRLESVQDYTRHLDYVKYTPEEKKQFDDYISPKIVNSAAGKTLAKTRDVEAAIVAFNSSTAEGVKRFTLHKQEADMAYGEAVGKLPKLREDAANGDPAAMAKLMKAEQEAEELGAKALAANHQVSALMAQKEKNETIAKGRAATQKLVQSLVQDDPEILLAAEKARPGVVNEAMDKGDPGILQDTLEKRREREAKAEEVKLQQIKGAPGAAFNPLTGETTLAGQSATQEQLAGLALKPGMDKIMQRNELVVDTKDGKNIVTNVTRAEILKHGSRYNKISPADVQKAERATAFLEDIRGSMKTMTDAISTLEKENKDISPRLRAELAYVLKAPDPRSAIQAFMQGLTGKGLSDKEMDFAVNYGNLVEQSMSIRTLLGGGQGSDELRATIRATLPSPRSPTWEYMKKQLSQVQNTITRVERGVPKVKLRGEEPTNILPEKNSSISTDWVQLLDKQGKPITSGGKPVFQNKQTGKMEVR